MTGSLRSLKLHNLIFRTMTTVRSTAASGSGVYESKRAVDEYLLFHFGDPQLLMPYKFGPVNALHFAERTSALASAIQSKKSRALDIGCAVGGLSFALARDFEEVVGIDYSQHFVDAANEMKKRGSMRFQMLRQGRIFSEEVATAPADVDRGRVTFAQGDACHLDKKIGTFDLIVASNLLCRLPEPKKFLRDVPSFLNKGGVLLLISPFSWLEEYTPVENWIGGSAEGESSDAVRLILEEAQLTLEHKEDVPFLIREHERKFQFGVSEATAWRKN